MPLSFFSNDGSLDAHESLRQMLSVTLRCSLRKVIVAGVIGDAAPSISGMYTLMRQSVPIPKYDLKLSKDICTVPHPYWKSLKVAMSLCSGHGMKRTRGQLFSSSWNGSRSFCIDGIFLVGKSFWIYMIMIKKIYFQRLYWIRLLSNQLVEEQ